MPSRRVRVGVRTCRVVTVTAGNVAALTRAGGRPAAGCRRPGASRARRCARTPRPGRPRRGSATAASSRSTCSSVVARPALTRTAVSCSSEPSPSSVSTRMCAQNLPARTPMPCSADSAAATRWLSSPSTVNGDDRAAFDGVAEERVRRDPVDAAQALDEPRGEPRLVRLDSGPVLAQRGARGSEGDRAEHVGAAGLVPRGTGGPPGLVLGHRGRGAAAGEVRLSGVQPVAPAREDPGAVGGVHLVPGEGDPVDVERRRGRAAGGPPTAPRRGAPSPRAGVARAVRRSTGHSSPVTFDAAVSTTSARRGCRAVPAGSAASAVSSSTSASRTLPGTGRRTVSRARHGSSVAWCSEAKTRTVVSRGSARASRLTESVVPRVKTTTSSSRGPDEAGDLVARGLVVGARHPRQPARAAVHRGVRARRGLDGTGDPLERRRGRRVVEVRVVDEVAREGGDEVGPHDGGQVLAGARLVAVRHARAGRGRDRRDGIRHGAQPRTAVEGGGGGAGDRHR